MGKAFTPAFNRAKNQATGTRPFFLLGINWGGGISYYATRTMTVGPIKAAGKILTISNLDFATKSNSMGAVGQLSLTMDDGDSEFENNMKLTRLEKKQAILYQGFEGLSSKDLGVMFLGEITGPVVWDEGTRNVSFSITSRVEDKDVGYSATDEDFTGLDPACYNVPWPMCFGEVHNVPAVRIKRQANGVLASGIKLDSDYAKYSKASKQLTTEGIEVHVFDMNTGEKDLIHLEERTPGDLASFEVYGNNVFDILIDRVRFSGTYNSANKTFKVQEANKPLYTGIKLANRDGTDPDEINFKKLGILNAAQNFWLPDDKYDLTGLLLYFKAPDGYQNLYHCVAQHGRKCTVDRVMRNPKTAAIMLPGAETVIEAAYAIGRSGGGVIKGELAYTYQWALEKNAKAELADIMTKKDSFMWHRPSGTEVKSKNADSDVYIVSCIEMSEITSVYAHKQEPLEVGKDLKVFKQLPSSQYSIQLQSDYPIGTYDTTSIQLATPMSQLDEGKWEENLYVSGVSTVGPNISDIIKYILNRYTDLQVDSSSFASVATKTSAYPANFAYLDRENVIKVCEDFAWQARCALVIDNNTAYLRFLGEAGNSVLVITESEIKMKSLSFGYTNTESIITKLLGSWTPDYRDSPRQTKYNQSRTRKTRELIRALTDDARVTENQTQFEIFEQNVEDFGLRTQEFRFNIYSSKSYVRKGLDFWGSRLSDTWKIASMTLFMPALHLQVFDTVKLDLPNFFNFQVDCLVTRATYNPATYEVDVELWLPIKAGGLTVAGDAYGT